MGTKTSTPNDSGRLMEKVHGEGDPKWRTLGAARSVKQRQIRCVKKTKAVFWCGSAKGI